MTFFFRLEEPDRTVKKKKEKVAAAPVPYDDTFEKLLGTKCDLQFLFRGINYSIGSHSAILKEKSWVFDVMVSKSLRGTEAKPARVLTRQMRPEVFKHLLHYIYTDTLSTPLTEGLVQPLYIIAVKYRIEQLEKKCISFMCKIMKDYNVVKMLAFFLSHTFPEHDVNKMKGKCECFIARNRHRLARYCMGKAWDKVVSCCERFQ